LGLIKKLIQVTSEKGLWKSEDDLMKALDRWKSLFYNHLNFLLSNLRI
jgi:hypothetical protein